MVLRQSFKFAIFSIYSIHIITRSLQFLDEEFDYEFFKKSLMFVKYAYTNCKKFQTSKCENLQDVFIVCLHVPSVMCCFFIK
jgi:hypothetical protein